MAACHLVIQPADYQNFIVDSDPQIRMRPGQADIHS